MTIHLFCRKYEAWSACDHTLILQKVWSMISLWPHTYIAESMKHDQPVTIHLFCRKYEAWSACTCMHSLILLCILRCLFINFCQQNATQCHFLLLPNNKILYWSKKQLQTTKWMWIKLWFLSLMGVENIVGKGENAGYQHFLLFPQCFQHSFSLKLRMVLQRVNKLKNVWESLTFQI